MNPILFSVLGVAAVSALSFIGVVALAFSDRLLRRILFVLVSLAAGALIGDAFIHLIPQSFAESTSSVQTGLLIISGILLFFLIEKLLHWHHSHGDHEHDQKKHHNHTHVAGHTIHPTGIMILISDGVHNLIDGIIIGASFLVSTELGIASTIAIILHEIPQEIGDFGVLLHAGFSKLRALFMNFLSALLSFMGLGIALMLAGANEAFLAAVIPITAGGFLYIATADLIPELHKETRPINSLLQIAAIVVGIVAMLALLPLESELGHEHGGESSPETHQESGSAEHSEDY